MEIKHTPGPWLVNYGTDICGEENDSENGCLGTVDIAHVYMRMVPGRHEANARLIAASPELLALAQRVAALNENAGEIGAGMLVQLVTEARKAVKKATE